MIVMLSDILSLEEIFVEIFVTVVSQLAIELLLNENINNEFLFLFLKFLLHIFIYLESTTILKNPSLRMIDIIKTLDLNYFFIGNNIT
jgi:hypothetical protein